MKGGACGAGAGLAVVFALLTAGPLTGQDPDPAPPDDALPAAPVVAPAARARPAAGAVAARTRGGPAAAGGAGQRLKFNAAPTDIVLQDYSEHTGRTLLTAPNLPKATITLQSQGELSMEEYLQAIETVLGMNGIALLKEGEKFLRVVPNAQARTEPMAIRPYDAANPPKESGELISQMIPLVNIEPAEAQKAIEPLKHASGQIHVFERINSLLLTDTAANVARIMEVLKYVDQAVEAKEEPIIVQIRFAKAEDVKRKLEEIIADQLKEQQKSTMQPARMTGRPGVEAVPSPVLSAVIRAPGAGAAAAAAAAAAQTLDLTSMAGRGVITGKVKIVADDRTNILILITRRENMTFFEKVISVLDVETAPEVMVKVFRLEYATADEVASMLNSLIGATGSPKDDAPKAAALPSRTVRPEGVPLSEYGGRRTTPTPTPAPSPVPGAIDDGSASDVGMKTKIGQLSKENIKIMSDKRSNSLIIMASRGDLATIEEIIKGMDMMLSQVLLECAVISVDVGGGIQSGMQWVQRSMTVYDKKNSGVVSPVGAFAGGGGGGVKSPTDATALTTAGSLAGNLAGGPGLSYYLTHFGLNMDAVLTMLQTDNRGRLLSTPVILTQDNTEAVIDSSSEQYYPGPPQSVALPSGGWSSEPSVLSRKVGLHMKIKPHINEKKNVLMEITLQNEDPGEKQQIGNQIWPTVKSREISASIAVRDRQTIVLGGLKTQQEGRTRAGVPFLYKIPLIGWFFQFRSSSESSSEVVVFVTPYVLNTPDEIMAESVRRGGALDARGLWKQDWSGSKLADPVKPTRRQIKYEKRILGAPLSETGKPTPAKVTGVEPSVIEHMNSAEDRWAGDLKRADEKVKGPAGAE
jgi:general secretion pathway protein D